MSLALYGHPFSPYTQRSSSRCTRTRRRSNSAASAGHAAARRRVAAALAAAAKFPLLLDGERQVVEQHRHRYLQLVHPGPVRLLPADPMTAGSPLDRFFDLHVMDAMRGRHRYRLGRFPATRANLAALARERLDRRPTPGSTDGLSAGPGPRRGVHAADCAAAPSLFYADWTHPFPDALAALRATAACSPDRRSAQRAVGRHGSPLFPRWARRTVKPCSPRTGRRTDAAAASSPRAGASARPCSDNGRHMNGSPGSGHLLHGQGIRGAARLVCRAPGHRRVQDWGWNGSSKLGRRCRASRRPGTVWGRSAGLRRALRAGHGTVRRQLPGRDLHALLQAAA